MQLNDAHRMALGHPLALALFAEVARHTEPGSAAWESLARATLEDFPDVVQALLSALVRVVPTDAHRDALRLCAIVRVTTEALLRELIAPEQSRELFEWLRALPFVESVPRGLLPHDLVRNAVVADFRWRDPAGFQRELGRMASLFLDRGERELLGELLYLFRHADAMRDRILDLSGISTAPFEVVEEDDWPSIEAMLRRHEGERAVEALRFWRAQGAETLIVRAPDGSAAGFGLELRLDRVTDEQARRDPGVAGPLRVVRGWALPDTRALVYYRFWMDRERYQDVSPVQSRIFQMFMLRITATPGVAAALSAHRDVEGWRWRFAPSPVQYLEGADFELGGYQYGVFHNDLRLVSQKEWLEQTFRAAFGGDPRPHRPILTLSEEEFGRAIKAALKGVDRPALLHDNPLLRSRMVTRGPVSRPARGSARGRWRSSSARCATTSTGRPARSSCDGSSSSPTCARPPSSA
jgi:hypothetical protein